EDRAEHVHVPGKVGAAETGREAEEQRDRQWVPPPWMRAIENGCSQDSPRQSPPEQRLCREPDWLRKQQHEILSPAIPKLAVVAVHAGADGSAGVAKANFPARAFYGAGEGNVFQNVAGNRGMASNRFID